MASRLAQDVASIQERDPACHSAWSALTNYPGLWAVWWHRFTHWLHGRGLVWLARFVSQRVRNATGIEIHPGATIGDRFFIDHGMGVVIGETCVIGNDVTLYQGVTLGGTGKEHGKRHPTIEDFVVIGVGATVLGNITIGRGSMVGAGAVVVAPVPSNCTVVGVPGRVVVHEGRRVDMIDLHHEKLPDPVIEMYRAMSRRLDRLEARLASDGEISVEQDTTVSGSQDIPKGDDDGTTRL